MKNLIAKHIVTGVATSTCILAATPSWAKDTTLPVVAEFSGFEEYAFPRATSLDLTEFGGIELWVSPDWGDDKKDDAALVSYMGPQGSRYSLVLTQDRQRIGLLTRESWDWASADFTDGRLHHVFINILGDFSEVYMDGKLAGTIETGTSNAFANRLHIGSLDGTHLVFEGEMAGIRIWDAPQEEDIISKYSSLDILKTKDHPNLEDLIGGSTWVSDGEDEGFSFILMDEADFTELDPVETTQIIEDELTLEDAGSPESITNKKETNNENL